MQFAEKVKCTLVKLVDEAEEHTRTKKSACSVNKAEASARSEEAVFKQAKAVRALCVRFHPYDKRALLPSEEGGEETG